MADKKKLESIFREHGFTDFRWFDPKEIVVAQWVRMKCQFGCGDYGQNACCPPNTPSVEECRQFFHDYSACTIFHFAKKVDKPEDRHAWSLGVNTKLLDLERAVFCAGHERAFVLFMDSCAFCKKCTGKREDCKLPKMGRPGPDAMAMDVYSTIRKAGYPIEVLPDYDRTMNRYAFLMVE
jgi:predicted metal-binding protein